jgi:hypothetical protein
MCSTLACTPEHFLQKCSAVVEHAMKAIRESAGRNDQKSHVMRRQICDAIRPSQAEAAAELDALLPSLLDRAFKGES